MKQVLEMKEPEQLKAKALEVKPQPKPKRLLDFAAKKKPKDTENVPPKQVEN